MEVSKSENREDGKVGICRVWWTCNLSCTFECTRNPHYPQDQVWYPQLLITVTGFCIVIGLQSKKREFSYIVSFGYCMCKFKYTTLQFTNQNVCYERDVVRVLCVNYSFRSKACLPDYNPIHKGKKSPITDMETIMLQAMVSISAQDCWHYFLHHNSN